MLPESVGQASVNNWLSLKVWDDFIVSFFCSTYFLPGQLCPSCDSTLILQHIELLYLLFLYPKSPQHFPAQYWIVTKFTFLPNYFVSLASLIMLLISQSMPILERYSCLLMLYHYAEPQKPIQEIARALIGSYISTKVWCYLLM